MYKKHRTGKQMRRLIFFLLFAMVINISGCGSAKNVKSKPSDEELSKSSTVCGIARDITDETIRVQLCGNRFEGKTGCCYMDVKNEYDITEGESVLIYYTGRVEYEEKDTYIEADNVDVCYMERYNNDGKFSANIHVNGLVPEGTDCDTSISYMYIKSLDDEPECDFIVKHVNGGENEIIIDLNSEWLSISDVVTVAYDIETMEVISITQ